jgi:hypothetical protein
MFDCGNNFTGIQVEAYLLKLRQARVRESSGLIENI